jgi:hypothetical protein
MLSDFAKILRSRCRCWPALTRVNGYCNKNCWLQLHFISVGTISTLNTTVKLRGRMEFSRHLFSPVLYKGQALVARNSSNCAECLVDESTMFLFVVSIDNLNKSLIHELYIITRFLSIKPKCPSKALYGCPAGLKYLIHKLETLIEKDQFDAHVTRASLIPNPL